MSGVQAAHQMGRSNREAKHMASIDLDDALRRANAGEESAWRSLIDAYAPRVFALVRSRCRNVDIAEEVTQSVFVTVASKLADGGYEEQGKFEAWLFRVAMNRTRDEIRKQRRRRETESDAIATLPQRSPDEPAYDNQAIIAMRDAIDQLSDQDREIIELRHHAQMSFRQLVDVLGEPLGTLLARHHRALRKLKDIMQPAAHANLDEDSPVSRMRNGTS